MSISKLYNDLRASVKLQTIIVWSVIYLILFIQTLWMNINLSLLLALMTGTCMIIIFYVNQTILIPRLFLKGRKWIYIITSLIIVIPLISFCANFELFLFKYFNVEPKHELKLVFSVSRFTVLYVLVYTVSSIISFWRKSLEDARQKEKLISDKKILEARVLKSQINSHFIFNALNNIYSMIYFKDEYISGYVLKLSQMMRYVMEDCESELTPLSKDMEYIENFIDFQKLRFDDSKDITFTHNALKSSILIPPMIFQPLIENCFKHCPLDVEASSYVHITLKVEGAQIKFIAENSQPVLKPRLDKLKIGIGIENVKRRLELYYNNNHELNIYDETNFFKVEMLINL